MEKKYNSIKRLIELWEDYEDETERQELPEFVEWLNAKIREKPELSVKPTKERIQYEKPEKEMLFKKLKEPIRFLEYTARISRLHDF